MKKNITSMISGVLFFSVISISIPVYATVVSQFSKGKTSAIFW
ncbi:hypothetical protein FACS189418_1290 [Clostridia bacterium]|nr:hypothetical protein FACS189418_1290 [Clostridia bacterium]